MRRKTPESLTGIETLQPLQAAGFVGSRKTPESLTGIETKAASNSAIVRGSMVAKPPNPSQGLKPCRAYSQSNTRWSQNPRIPHRD